MLTKYRKIITSKRINLQTVLLIILGVFLPLIPALKGIFSGGMPFWNDPARDMLAGLNNLKKPSLIGPPSGIPGIFYGPYWIWLISFIQLFFKDPRIIVLCSQLIPTTIIFCFVFYKVTQNIDKYLWIPLWWIFAITYTNYFVYSWNPHLGPPAFMLLFYLVFKITTLVKKNIIYFIATGFISGLLVHVHMSFGAGAFIGSFLYLVSFLIYEVIRSKAKSKIIMPGLINLMSFLFGFAVTFAPHVLFELRHDFLQTKAFLFNVTESVFKRRNIVGYDGIDKKTLWLLFIDKGSEVFKLPQNIWRIILLATTAIIVFKLKRKVIKFSPTETRSLAFLALICISILAFYSFSKNPVWSYHLIGLEIIVLLVTSIAAKKLKSLRKMLIVWAAILFILFIRKFYIDFYIDALIIKSYASKKYSVDLIYQDTKNKPFAAEAFAANSYTFEYEYLFRWLSKKYKLPLPQEDKKDLPVYLIIPEEGVDLTLDFINYKTPRSDYLTEKTWYLPNGTMVLKRVARKL